MTSLIYLIGPSVQIILFLSPACGHFILFCKSESPLFYFSVRRVTSLIYLIGPSVQIILFLSPACGHFIFFISPSVQIFFTLPYVASFFIL
jgi:hypothetical protein